jgi:hypothetical protein
LILHLRAPALEAPYGRVADAADHEPAARLIALRSST